MGRELAQDTALRPLILLPFAPLPGSGRLSRLVTDIDSLLPHRHNTCFPMVSSLEALAALREASMEPEHYTIGLSSRLRNRTSLEGYSSMLCTPSYMVSIL